VDRFVDGSGDEFGDKGPAARLQHMSAVSPRKLENLMCKSAHL
jgi:hypothetical protein